MGWPPTPITSSGMGLEPDPSSQQWHGFEQANPMVCTPNNSHGDPSGLIKKLRYVYVL